jgi:hypothetical protein
MAGIAHDATGLGDFSTSTRHILPELESKSKLKKIISISIRRRLFFFFASK